MNSQVDLFSWLFTDVIDEKWIEFVPNVLTRSTTANANASHRLGL